MRTRLPPPDQTMRWQNNCQTSLRRRLPRSMRDQLRFTPRTSMC